VVAHRRLLLLAAGALLVALSLWAALRGRGDDAGQPPAARRIVLVGIDAADWLAIDPLIRSGKLPTFARFRSLGRTGVMLSTPPLVSPMLWTTIATGVEPENHGVLDFTADLADGRQVAVGSSQRLAPAVWNLWSDAGRRVAVVGWWATWPAEQVNGTIVSDALAPQLTRSAHRSDAGLVSPASSVQRVLAHVVHLESLSLEDLSAYAPVTREQHTAIGRQAADAGSLYRDTVTHLAAVVAGTRSYLAVAEDLLRSERPDLLAVYFEAVDTLSHLFVKTAGRDGRVRAIERAYEDADAILRRLAEASPAETLVVLCSDHGFYPATAGIVENPSDLTGPATAWHRPYGIVAVATAGTLATGTAGSDLPGPGSLGLVTPLDLAPTILHAADLPIPADMPGRVVREMLPVEARDREPRRTASRKFARVPVPDAARSELGDAIARLQALGYVGSSRTSLARQNLGESLLRRGKFAAAERQLRGVLDVQPNSLAAQLWLAQALERQGRSAAALAVYQQAVKLPGGAREALVTAVDLALAHGDLTAAKRLIASGSTAGDARAAFLVASGAWAEAQGTPETAEANYRLALELAPELFDATARLFDLFIASGRADQALDIAQRSARAVPESPRHVALLGEAHLAVGDAEAAEKALRRALELAPDGDQIRIVLGRALVAQRKFDAAAGILDAVGASADRDVVLGAAYSGKRDFQRAAHHLAAALEAGRATPEVLNGLGYAYLQLGRRQDALSMFERSLTARSKQPEIRRLADDLRKR
jgi:tetratricopeptide (TPR) repeat protein